MEIFNIRDIPKRIKEEGLDLCITSFGGTGTNTLSHAMEENGFVCRTKIWHEILCHFPRPFKAPIPLIYLYRDPKAAFLSMKGRGVGIWDVNQRKLSNNPNAILSDENLLRLMLEQYKEWTSVSMKNLLVLYYEELFEEHARIKLEEFLQVELCNFPLERKDTQDTRTLIDEDTKHLFKLFSAELENI